LVVASSDAKDPCKILILQIVTSRDAKDS